MEKKIFMNNMIQATSTFGTLRCQRTVKGLLLHRFAEFPDYYRSYFFLPENGQNKLVTTDINNEDFPLNITNVIIPGDFKDGGGIYLVVTDFVIFDQEDHWFLISGKKMDKFKTPGEMLQGECHRENLHGSSDIFSYNFQTAALV